MKVLICGGRDLNEELVCTWLTNNFLTIFPECTIIIHGDAKGADRGARLFCERHNFPVKAYPANWDKYNNAAGPIRNEQMLKVENPDCVLAFPGKKGTSHMCKIAKQAKKPVYKLQNF